MVLVVVTIERCPETYPYPPQVGDEAGSFSAIMHLKLATIGGLSSSFF